MHDRSPSLHGIVPGRKDVYIQILSLPIEGAQIDVPIGRYILFDYQRTIDQHDGNIPVNTILVEGDISDYTAEEIEAMLADD